MKFILVHVERLPREPEPGKLYWSQEFQMSGHLCACGCCDFIQLPVTPVDYSITSGDRGPTLRPSVGNWGICDAHYFITNGEVAWCGKWTPEQIAAGRAAEDARRAAYFGPKRHFIFQAIMDWVRGVLAFLGIGRR